MLPRWPLVCLGLVGAILIGPVERADAGVGNCSAVESHIAFGRNLKAYLRPTARAPNEYVTVFDPPPKQADATTSLYEQKLIGGGVRGSMGCLPRADVPRHLLVPAARLAGDDCLLLRRLRPS